MKVRCLSNASKKGMISPFLPNDDRPFHITPDQEYTVYGLSVDDGRMGYLIADDTFRKYPMFLPGALFGPPTGSLPTSCKVFAEFTPEGRLSLLIVGQKEFSENPYFYDQLTDGEPSAQQAWLKFRQMVDREEESKIGFIPDADP